MEELRKQGSRLREEVRRLGKLGPGRRVPRELREALLEYMRGRREQRASLHTIADEVGVSDATLVRWSKPVRENGNAKLLPVQVVRVPAGGAEGIVVHGPGGVRVEGLDVCAVAELFRRLA
jgi:transposase